jgi:cysteine-rich repeat protein
MNKKLRRSFYLSVASYLLLSCSYIFGAKSNCGDEKVQEPEECDDGNHDNTDDCTGDCQEAKCGDRFVQEGEQCDDGNKDNSDDCTTLCDSPRCGDGIVSFGEGCDPPNTATCDARCSSICRTTTDCPEVDLCQRNNRCENGRCISDPIPTDDNNDCTIDHCDLQTGTVQHVTIPESQARIMGGIFFKECPK